MDEVRDAHPPIECYPYSIEKLRDILSIAGKTTAVEAACKLHLVYFKEYFSYFEKRGPLTIVIEWQYTDRDYLEDYAAYYVRCFGDKYSPPCVRLHFFQGELSKSSFVELQSSPDKEEAGKKLSRTYLGFMVVRPLPTAFIGRTCLRTYDREDRRFYPVTRPCASNLLGFKLNVDSLAFQEQDKIAAACATSALWSVLHGTSSLFRHRVLSPIEITKIATDHSPGVERAIPSRGLRVSQMVAAVRAVGLEPIVKLAQDKAALQALAYAYLRARIPILLNAALFDCSNQENPMPYGGKWNNDGHAVTITGYSLGHPQAVRFPGTETLLCSSKINKLYVHDDQVGPFARLEFDGPDFVADPNGKKKPVKFSLKSSWRGASGEVGTVVFTPGALIIPVYHKIRIQFDTILRKVLAYDENMRKTPTAKWQTEKSSCEWDVYLITQDDLKFQLRDSTRITLKRRWELLSRPMPRFIWRAQARISNIPHLDLLYDATDIDDSRSLLFERIIYSDA